MTSSQSPRTPTFEARDGRSLVGSLFEPDGSPRAALLVSSGTGIPRRQEPDYMAAFFDESGRRSVVERRKAKRTGEGTAIP